MLPSMPILFSRESQDAFGNKIEPSTSLLGQKIPQQPIVKPAQPTPVPPKPPPPPAAKAPPKKRGRKKKAPEELPKIDPIASDTAIAKSYYQKVQSRFSANSKLPSNKFVQFQDLLKKFDIHKEDPKLLLKKVEVLFGEDHKDLADEFLMFLSSGQAIEMGKFDDHFMMTQFTHFLQMLQISFARKPTILRKVMRAIVNSANSGNVAEAKSKVLPHLRSVPRLADMFKSFFHDARPPDSLYENGVETLDERFLTEDDGFEEWQFEDHDDTPRSKDSNTLDSVYLQGRVFLQHGRNLRPARVSFPFSKEPYRVHAERLGADPGFDSADAQPSSPKKNNKNKPAPVTNTKKTKNKEAKDVNDNTKNKANEPKSKQKSSKAKSVKKTEDKDKEPAAPKKRTTSDNKKDEATKSKQSKLTVSEAKRVTKLDVSKHKEEAKSCRNGKETKSAKVNLSESKNVTDNLSDTKSATVNLSDKKSATVNLNDTKIATVNLSDTKSATVNLSDTKKDVKSNSWTRDEDKTMLETIKVESMTDKAFVRIKDLLPHRSVSEIKERFFHVLNLLQQMSSEVK